VLAAGGDGTVAAVARELTGSAIPILPLPLGTANNIATWLGAPRDLLRILAARRVVPFDAGVCRMAGGDQLYFEAAGLGPFPQVIDRLDGMESDRSRAEQLKHASDVLTHVAAGAPAYPCRLEIDERQIEGTFLMVEVMNIGMMGPGLVLANAANPGDGLLDVVAVRESERSPLVAYLAERALRPGTPAPFQSQRARRAHLQTAGPAPLHIDDRAMICAPSLDATFSVRPHAVSFLVEPPLRAPA
jgi:diacylglycerol kinase (ATP)